MKNLAKKINVLTTVDIELPALTRDVEVLEELLKILKENSAIRSMAYCYVHTILQTTKHDVLSLKKMMEQVINDTQKSNLKAELKDDLGLLNNLLNRCEKLEGEFRPYLFCPALEEQS